MRIMRRTAAAALAVGCVLLATACGQGDRSGQEQPEDPVATAIAEALAESGMPGAAVALLRPDGESTVVTYGEAAPGAEVGEDTRFAYRSITKSFVGTVVLQLADEGRIDLDTPVTQYLPDVGLTEPPTIRELAVMRSGVANYSAAPELGALLTDDPAREPATDELIALALPASPVFVPGLAYEYSNTNTLLLGEAIAAVTGRPWQTEVAERILRPLELDSVAYGFDAAGPAAEGFQLGADGEREALPAVAPGWFGAAGGLTGTVTDLAEWGRALGDGSLVSERSQRERLAALGPITDDPLSPRYDAYGFAIGEIDGWIGHTGAGLGYQSLTMHDPDTGRTVAILLNGTGEDQDRPAAIFRSLLPALG